MNSKKAAWRTVAAFAMFAGLTTALVLPLNLGGWRALVLSRIVRVENWPVVVRPPPNFAPKVPPGFAVSVFAKAFAGPRWLAVAPNGDVFVADSAAGQVIVLGGVSASGGASSVFRAADRALKVQALDPFPPDLSPTTLACARDCQRAGVQSEPRERFFGEASLHAHSWRAITRQKVIGLLCDAGVTVVEKIMTIRNSS
jgi:hypothetical protein